MAGGRHARRLTGKFDVAAINLLYFVGALLSFRETVRSLGANRPDCSPKAFGVMACTIWLSALNRGKFCVPVPKFFCQANDHL
jgi:hypothetical protein